MANFWKLTEAILRLQLREEGLSIFEIKNLLNTHQFSEKLNALVRFGFAFYQIIAYLKIEFIMDVILQKSIL